MKLPSVLFLSTLLTGGALAADLFSTLPACALDCFQTTVGDSSCSATDFGCLCLDQQFLGATQLCQAQSCTVKEILTSTNATLAACGTPIKDQSDTLIGTAMAFGAVAIILVVLRVAGRFWITKSGLYWDDWLITAALAFACVLNFSCIPMAKAGMGRDFWAIPFSDISLTFKLLYLAEIFYMVAEMLVQLSLLAFYNRVFPEGTKLVRVGTAALIVVVVCFGIANTFTMIFQCTPVPFFWNNWTGETTGTCIDINLFSWIRAAIEIAIDISILSLPLPSLFKLQMNWKKKSQVLVMFGLGFVITIVSILRLQSLIHFSKTQNPTYDNTPGVYWSVIECNMFIICACMPPVRSVVLHLFRGEAGTSSSYSYPSGAKYIRQGDSKNPPSHQMRSLGQSDSGMKSQDGGVTGSDEELVTEGKWASSQGR